MHAMQYKEQSAAVTPPAVRLGCEVVEVVPEVVEGVQLGSLELVCKTVERHRGEVQWLAWVNGTIELLACTDAFYLVWTMN